MGLMDRVKAQATQLAQATQQAAQQAAQEGRARLDQAQASRRGDQLLRQLGVLVLADRTGRGTADSQAKIDQLISEITAYEQANGLNLAQPPWQPGFPAGPQDAPGGQSPQGQQSPQGPQPPFGGPAASTFPGAGGGSFPDPSAQAHDAPPVFFGAPGGGDATTGAPPVFFPAPGPDDSADQGDGDPYPPQG